MKMKMIIELLHQKLIEVMLVNGIKKPKPLYNVCPKTMLLSILQQTLSIHQVQLLTSLEQTKNYKHTHTGTEKPKKTRRGKRCAEQSTWSNEAIYHIPPIVYNRLQLGTRLLPCCLKGT